jgi:benzoate membrane transport protein
MGQPILAGLIAAVVGFFTAFALVLSGLHAVGASPAEAASGLFVLCLGMGLLGLYFSVRHRMPIGITLSTPGAALLAGSGLPRGGFPAAVGAFLLAGGLLVATGLSRRLTGWVNAVPRQLAAGMLAGILLPLCTVPVRALAHIPGQAVPVVLVWAAATRFVPRWAVPLATVTAAVALVADPPAAGLHLGHLGPRLSLTAPHFTLGAVVGIGIPLYLVTMASQNIPGIAVLAANGYEAPVRPVLLGTGGASMLGSFAGGLPLNLAAITAAMIAGPVAHRDPARRWIAAVANGAAYLLLGLGAAVVTALSAAASPLLVETVAGLALLGALGTSLATALTGQAHREAALVAFVVSACGQSVAGIGSPFWGLLAGLAFLGLRRRRGPARPPVDRAADGVADRTADRGATPAGRAEPATPATPATHSEP